MRDLNKPILSNFIKSEKMTVLLKIRLLNSEFQKSYYDGDIDFFNFTAPEMIRNIIEFMASVVPEEHPLRKTIEPHLGLLHEQIEPLKEIDRKSNPDDSVKDNYINYAKNNVSKGCWRIAHAIWRYDARMLDQVI